MSVYPLLKHKLDRPLLEQLAQRLQALEPGFPVGAFVEQTAAQLPALEFKARNWLIAAQLRAYLPGDYATALRLLLGLVQGCRSQAIEDARLRLMALPVFIERYGLQAPEVSLRAMPILTRTVSCEFALRPFLERYPQQTLAWLGHWLRDESEHVRRLVSEGTRPRLPWAAQLPAFIADPAPTLALLEQLKDDPSLYVRRSVANHLNDIGKDHPQLLVERMAIWRDDAPSGRLWLIRHALRSLLKQGDAGALAILGFAAPRVSLQALELAPELEFGQALRFAFSLQSNSDKPQRLMVDYVLQLRKANGKLAPTVFKLKQLELPAGGRVRLEKAHVIRPVSSRRYYAGGQRLEIQVNGQRLGGRDFLLLMP